MSQSAPGWYIDAAGVQRWWDGTQWTQTVASAPARQAGNGPLTPPPSAPAYAGRPAAGAHPASAAAYAPPPPSARAYVPPQPSAAAFAPPPPPASAPAYAPPPASAPAYSATGQGQVPPESHTFAAQVSSQVIQGERATLKVSIVAPHGMGEGPQPVTMELTRDSGRWTIHAIVVGEN